MRRGDIRWARLRAPTGSEPGYRRPVLVVQADDFNASSIRTTVVLSITSNLRLAEAPGNVLLKRENSGLPRDSVVNVSQILTLDKASIGDYVASLPDNLLARVDEGVGLVLGLMA